MRTGLISLEDLQPFAARVYIDEAVFRQISADAKVASPGMKYRHYAPTAKLIPVDAPDFQTFADYVTAHAEVDTFCLLFDSDPEVPGVRSLRYGDTAQQQAHYLFL